MTHRIPMTLKELQGHVHRLQIRSSEICRMQLTTIVAGGDDNFRDYRYSR